MDKDYKEKLEMEERVLVLKRVYMIREDLEVFGAHTENFRRRAEEELRGIVKEEAESRHVSSGNAPLASSSNSGGDGARTGSSGQGNESSRCGQQEES